LSIDTLSEVLRAVRLTGAVFFTIDASTPWVAEAPAAREVGPHLMPGSEQVIEFHVVARGTMWGNIAGESAEAAIRLEAGDAIMFPQGDPHVLSSAPGMRADTPDNAAELALAERLPVRIRKHGGGPEGAEVICGFLGCDVRPFNPLLNALPRVIHLKHDPSDGGMVDSFVKLALAESVAERPGSQVVLQHLSELLFVEAVRRHLLTLPPEKAGWLGGLRDENIGKVLGKMHNRPTHAWSLEELAREAGLSRSVLAERFNHFVGTPPMQYLAQWRMQLASTLLATTALNLAEVADQVGYGSETALSHAFKRWVGVAPADWRRGKRAPEP
jgi:AraC-like DNA-binding protein